MDSSPTNSKRGHSRSASNTQSLKPDRAAKSSACNRRSTLDIPLSSSSPTAPATPKITTPHLDQQPAASPTQLPPSQPARSNSPVPRHPQATHDYLGPNGLSPQQYRQQAFGAGVMQLHARLDPAFVLTPPSGKAASSGGTLGEAAKQDGRNGDLGMAEGEAGEPSDEKGGRADENTGSDKRKIEEE